MEKTFDDKEEKTGTVLFDDIDREVKKSIAEKGTDWKGVTFDSIQSVTGTASLEEKVKMLKAWFGTYISATEGSLERRFTFQNVPNHVWFLTEGLRLLMKGNVKSWEIASMIYTIGFAGLSKAAIKQGLPRKGKITSTRGEIVEVDVTPYLRMLGDSTPSGPNADKVITYDRFYKAWISFFGVPKVHKDSTNRCFYTNIPDCKELVCKDVYFAKDVTKLQVAWAVYAECKAQVNWIPKGKQSENDRPNYGESGIKKAKAVCKWDVDDYMTTLGKDKQANMVLWGFLRDEVRKG